MRRHYTEDGHEIILGDNAVYFIPKGVHYEQTQEYARRLLDDPATQQAIDAWAVTHDTITQDDFSIDANASSSVSVPPLTDELRSELVRLTAEMIGVDWRNA
jgi:hypothetical protein